MAVYSKLGLEDIAKYTQANPSQELGAKPKSTNVCETAQDVRSSSTTQNVDLSSVMMMMLQQMQEDRKRDRERERERESEQRE